MTPKSQNPQPHEVCNSECTNPRMFREETNTSKMVRHERTLHMLLARSKNILSMYRRLLCENKKEEFIYLNQNIEIFTIGFYLLNLLQGLLKLQCSIFELYGSFDNIRSKKREREGKWTKTEEVSR